MSKKVNLGRQGFEPRAYKNAIDVSFTQLIPPPPPQEDIITVDEFFGLYDSLFYEIPATGDINSHQYLINRSTEYIGFTEEKEQDIQILLDEITSLREELLTTQKELFDTQVSSSLELQNLEATQIGTQITPTDNNVGQGGLSSGGSGGSGGGGGGGGY